MGLYLLALTAASRWPPLLRAFPRALGQDEPMAATVAVQPSAGPEEPAAPAPPTLSPAARRRGLAALALVAAAVCQASAKLERRLGVPGSSTIAICFTTAALARAVRRRVPAVRPLLPLLGAPSLLLCCIFLGGMGASAQLGQVCQQLARPGRRATRTITLTPRRRRHTVSRPAHTRHIPFARGLRGPAQVVAAGPAAATLGAVVLVIHCAVVLAGVRLLNGVAGSAISLRTLLVASNANIGGPGTAMAMASAMGWPQLVRCRRPLRLSTRAPPSGTPASIAI
eukprot:3834019-Prymnesium_polylepis.1